MFRATEGSTESVPLVFGVETVLWPTSTKKGGKWCRGVVEAAACFMTRWHRDEEDGYATQQRTPRVMTREGGGRKGGAAVLILLSTNECRNEMVDRVARYRFD